MSATPNVRLAKEAEPWLEPGHTYASVTDQISSAVLTRPLGIGWLAGFALTFSVVMMLFVAIAWLIIKGVGIWGINIPIGWGFAIVNFVWWIGIGHAGTLISAILLLAESEVADIDQSLCGSDDAVCGGLRRIVSAAPYRAAMAGVLAVPVPEHDGNLAAVPQPADLGRFCGFDVRYGFADVLVRGIDAGSGDAARPREDEMAASDLSGCCRWAGADPRGTGSGIESAYLMLAGLATPLVLSVHTIVSFDFAVAHVPGWHTTIFPPYFVAGAIYSGFAMVLTLAIPMRAAYGMQDFITLRHLEQMAKVMLATGLIVAYGYFVEFFMAFYSGNKFDVFLANQRLHGPYSHFYYALILCNILTPQLLWFRKVRRNIPALFIISLIINTGMWLERFVIVVISLTRDFMPSAWGRYSATVWDYATFVGTLGLFTMLIFLFVRGLPAIAISEMRELVHQESHGEGGHE